MNEIGIIIPNPKTIRNVLTTSKRRGDLRTAHASFIIIYKTLSVLTKQSLPYLLSIYQLTEDSRAATEYTVQ